MVGRPPNDPDTTTFRGRFAARLRDLRVKRYASQDEFVSALKANGVETTKQTVSGWETGYRLPRWDDLPAIAATLGVSVRSLLPTS